MDGLTTRCSLPGQRLHDNFILDDLTDVSARINRLDGLKIELGGSWVLLRPSGTEPIMRVIAEAESAILARRPVDEGIRPVTECLAEEQ